MERDIGTMLQTMRLAQGMSLRSLAAKAGIGKSTLSYWEAGQFQPRLPELEAILIALGASETQRREALERIKAPRAVQQLREETRQPLQEARLGSAPSGSDLLRAMRHRRGLLQEQVAERMGVSPATISRWEQGRAAPSQEWLDRFCTLLGAEPAERAALQDISCFQCPPLNAVASSPNLLRELCFGMLWPNYYFEKVARSDLLYLTFAAQAWHLAAQHEGGQRLLAELYTNYASYIVGLQRYEEAERFAERALHLLPSGALSEPIAIRAALVCARAKAYRPGRPAIRSAIATLQPWTGSKVNLCYRAWAIEGIAEYLALQGEWSSAIAACREACQIAACSEDPADLREQQMKLAKLLNRAGQPADALPLLLSTPDDVPALQTEVALRRAEALLALGDRSGAQSLFEQVCAGIEAYDLAYLRFQAAPLQRHLE